MKLSEVRQEYYDSTGTVSTLVRSICFSGIAVSWAILVGDKSPIPYDHNIGWVFLFLLLSLLVDLLQYVTKAATWGLYNDRKQNQGIGLDDEVEPPAWFNTFPIVFWIVKTALALIGIGILCACLWHCVIHPKPKNTESSPASSSSSAPTREAH